MDKDEKKSTCCQKSTLSVICAGFLALFGIALIIAGTLILLYFSDAVEAIIKSKLPIQNGSEVTEAWMAPPIRPLLRVYLFNVTNPEGFLAGDKPKLQEIGPFVYEEIWSKENVSWYNNGEEVEFSPVKTYHFREDLSYGPETQKLMLPNIPMISALASLRYADLLVRMALGSMLEILKQEPFVMLSVKDILWGFDHPLVKLGKDVLPPSQRFPHDSFGFFVGRNGSSSGLLRARTGLHNIEDLGQLVAFNGKDKLSFWKGDQCNAIKGTDGSLFHPGVLQNETLYIFSRDLCQSMPLIFDQEVVSSGLPGYRFVPPPNVFSYGSDNPARECYCMADEGCAHYPAGLFNMSACQFGSPVVMSWPHFYQADRILLDAVEGLNPNKEKHEFFIDIQPKLGNGLRAAAKTQINLMITESAGVKQAEGLRDIVFPILWLSEGIDEISDEKTIQLLKFAVITPDRVRNALIPTCFAVGSALFVIAVIIVAYRKWIEHDREVFHIKTGKVTYETSPVPAAQHQHPSTSRFNGSSSSGSRQMENGHFTKRSTS